jgi:hypothetical protein
MREASGVAETFDFRQPKGPTHVLFHADEIVRGPAVNQPGCTGSESDPVTVSVSSLDVKALKNNVPESQH